MLLCVLERLVSSLISLCSGAFQYLLTWIPYIWHWSRIGVVAKLMVFEYLHLNCCVINLLLLKCFRLSVNRIIVQLADVLFDLLQGLGSSDFDGFTSFFGFEVVSLHSSVFTLSHSGCFFQRSFFLNFLSLCFLFGLILFLENHKNKNDADWYKE